jgi:hypothetical protein
LLAKYMQHTPIRGAAHNTTHPPVRAHGSERWREAGQAHLPVRAPRVRCHGLSGAGRQGRMRVRRFCQERAHRHARELRGLWGGVAGALFDRTARGDAVTWSPVISGCARTGDLVSWNVMITAYAKWGRDGPCQRPLYLHRTGILGS